MVIHIEFQGIIAFIKEDNVDQVVRIQINKRTQRICWRYLHRLHISKRTLEVVVKFKKPFISLYTFNDQIWLAILIYINKSGWINLWYASLGDFLIIFTILAIFSQNGSEWLVKKYLATMIPKKYCSFSLIHYQPIIL